MAERDSSHAAEGVKPSGYPSFKENPPSVHESPGASDKVGEEATGLKQKMSEDVRTVRRAATEGFSQASDRARDAADEQKNIIAEQLSGFASAIEKVGSELEGDNQRTVGNMTKRLGSSMRKFADDIKDRNLGQVAGIAEDFGRRQPAAFLGMAALAGFAASRFLAASGGREMTKTANGGRSDRMSEMGGSSEAPASREDRING